MKRYIKFLYSSFVIGLIFGSIMLFVGMQNNSQGELIDIDSGKIDFLYAFFIFSTWFFLAAASCFFISCAIAFLFDFIDKNKKK